MRVYPGVASFSLYLPTSDWEGRYNAYGVEVSRGNSGVYEPMTVGVTYSQASFQIPELVQYDVAGKDLELLVNGSQEVTVSFTSPDPADVLAALVGAAPSIMTAENVDGSIVVSTVSTGIGSSLQIVGGDAAPALYHDTTVPTKVFYGTDAHRPLTAGVQTYQFVDPFRSDTNVYRFYYFNTLTSARGSLSPDYSGRASYKRPREEMIVGSLELLDSQGRPRTNKEVLVYVDRDPSNRIITPDKVQAWTDDTGTVSFLLLRGLECTLSIVGTGLMRKIRVPTEGETFNLLAPEVGVEPDNFQVQVPNIQVGARRTL